MNTPKEIGEYLQRLRKAKGLTQADLAKQLGIAPPSLAQFETGRKNMTLATLNKLADALGYELNVSFTLKREKKNRL